MLFTDKTWKDVIGYGLFWSLVAIAATAFVIEAVREIAARAPGDVEASRAPWLALHALVALPILIIAPLQFNPWIRRAKPLAHRWLGRAFLSLALVGAASAIVLGATVEYTGSRVPLVLFGVVWMGVAIAAWTCARQGDFLAHRAFAIRTFAIAFAFVWVRLLRELEAPLLGFMESAEMRAMTREWLSFVVPLLIVEIWLSWAPAIRNAYARSRKQRPSSLST